MPTTIRPAAPDDAHQILAIYAPFVMDTPVSFEVEPPTVAAMGQRIAETTARFPWLVCARDGKVLGYAYAGRYRTRTAYQWSAEVSVYVHAGCRRLGVGRGLYRSLFAILARQGFCNAYAVIVLPNPSSVGLHESLGFQSVGVYRSAGYKLGRWHDVGWWQLTLQEHPPAPAPPLDFTAVQASEGWEAALGAGLPLIRAL